MTKISERAKEAAGLPSQGGQVALISNAAMTGPPPGMDEAEMKATAGLGTSSDSEDNLVPRIYVLHYTDGRVDERGPDYIPGARPGDIALRGAPEGMDLVKSDVGLLFQPCYFWNDVTEWFEENDGAKKKTFISKHDYETAREIPGARQGSKGKWHWVTADGKNTLEDTRNFAGFVCFQNGLHMPFLISLKGTGHSFGKAWMTKINSKMSDKGVVYASFAAFYRLRTEPRSKGTQRWFMYTATDGRWATPEERAMGLRLHDQFRSGEKRAEEPMRDFEPNEGDNAQGAGTNKVDENI